MPPLDDERWQLLVQAVLADDDEPIVRPTRFLDLRHPVKIQRATDDPSGRRNSTSS